MKPQESSGARGVHDITEGGVRGHVLRMTLFILVGMAIQTLYGLVDIYWVGRLGKQAVAAVALSSNLMFVSLAVTQTLSVGCVALVSQAAGKKDHAEVQRLFNQAQCLSTLAGALFLAVALAAKDTYADRLAGDPETARLAREFLAWFLPALGLQFTMVGLASSLRGIGNMRPGLVAQTASVLLNMALAPVLVFGWGTGRAFGVPGAAMATLFATVAAVLGLFVYLRVGDRALRLRAAHWRPDLATFGRMLAIGVPAGAEFLLMSLSMGAVYAVTRRFGAEAQAGFGVGSRVLQAGMMPAVALSFAAAAVVGQNFGSRKFARVRQTFRESAKLALGAMLALTIALHLAPRAVVSLFADEAAVQAAGVDYVTTISWGYAASGLVFVSAGIFQGLGNTWPSLGASVLRVALFVGPMLFMSRRADFTLHATWITSVVSVFIQLGVQQVLLWRELERRAPA